MEKRWTQRFENYEKAYKNLEEVLTVYSKDKNSKIYQLALIQAFEITVELGWKVLKDYLGELKIITLSPKETIKQAFSQELIEDGKTWIKMLDDRNLASHLYDEENANKVVKNIFENYSKTLFELTKFFKEKVNE